MADKKKYDYEYFVIGAGSGGARSARVAASHGVKVGLAEVEFFGGTCVNVGCVPKKLFVYGSGFRKSFEDARSYGWDFDNLSFDWQTLLQAKNNEIDRLSSNSKKNMIKAGVDVYDGYAEFVDDHTIKIGSQTVTAEKILIATGGTPHLLDIPGKEHFITSQDAFYMQDLPEDILIVGGGYIAVEFAYIYHGMGVNVTIMNRSNTLLKEFDHDLQELLIDDMQKKGMTLQLGQVPTELTENNGKITVKDDSGTSHTYGAVMAATGRVPNTAKLGLENTGVKTKPNGAVIIDDEMKTSIDHIYALGDVANDHNLTPVAIREGHALADHLFDGQAFRKIDYDKIPTGIFTQPPIGTVGMSESEAAAKNINYAVYKSNFRPMKNSISGRDERTFMKLIVDKDTDKILGFHMFGEDSPEIIQLAGTIMMMGGTKQDLDNTVAVHPSAAEEFVLMKTEAQKAPPSKLQGPPPKTPKPKP